VEGFPGAYEIFRDIKEPEPCPYLQGQISRTEIRICAAVQGRGYARFLAAGYRRFGNMIFRPACESCNACTPIRVPVERFRASRSQRRVVRRNRDVQVEIGQPRADADRLELHRIFHRERSARVGWKRQEITRDEYSAIFLENIVPTLELRYRIEGRLVAIAYVDESPESLNSIYCIRHPEEARRGLGTFDILTEIDLARRMGRPYLYLGYYIARCRSMAYKAAFRPAEVLIDGEWQEKEADS